jgi:hypothetical protein
MEHTRYNDYCQDGSRKQGTLAASMARAENRKLQAGDNLGESEDGCFNL